MSMRQRKVTPSNQTSHKHGPAKANARQKETGMSFSQLTPAVLDIYSALSMVLGGCCSNVLAYEKLLLMNPYIGSALTFAQMLFISLHSLPSFLEFPKSSVIPRLKPRQVPLGQWAIQVIVVISGSLLNNWAFAYNVPLTILIVFRSAGLPVSMFFGYVFLKKQYTLRQIFSVALVTSGVILVTLSRKSPSSSDKNSQTMNSDDLKRYIMGISMMTVSLLCTGVLGMLQETTYGKYGPCWREGVFYTHFLSLPFFMFLGTDIKQGLSSLVSVGSHTKTAQSFAILFGNLFTQLICVSGVNKLSSQVSSVSTNIALTARKAFSLCFSVWWFGNEWNAQLVVGAFMVFFGSFSYSYTLHADKNKKQT